MPAGVGNQLSSKAEPDNQLSKSAIDWCTVGWMVNQKYQWAASDKYTDLGHENYFALHGKNVYQFRW